MGNFEEMFGEFFLCNSSVATVWRQTRYCRAIWSDKSADTRRVKNEEAFEKLRKATVCFIMSARPSIRMEQLGSFWTNLMKFWFDCFSKICLEISSFIKIALDGFLWNLVFGIFRIPL
jgi:hypothetical protein